MENSFIWITLTYLSVIIILRRSFEMTKVRTLVALLLALVLVVSTACSGDTKTEDTTSGKETTGENKTEEKADEKKDEDASEPMEEELEHVELTWYYIGGEQENEDKVFAAANEIIKEKINATVTFERYSFGEYPQTMQLLMSSGEKIDLLFTADWSLNYSELVSKGGLAELDGLIETYMPQTNELIPSPIWDATRIGGNIYGVPNYQVSYRQPALIFKKDIVDKYDLKDDIFAIKKMSDLTAIFETVQAGEPDMYMTSVSPAYMKFDVLDKADFVETFVGMPGGVNFDLEVIDLGTDPKYQALAEADFELSKLWADSGYYHPDASLAVDLTPEKQAGKFFVLEDVYKPGVESDMKNRYGYDVYAVPMGLPVLSTGSITATLTSISQSSENPERAAMLIELMNSDVELYNLIVFGLEGEQYNMVGDNRIELIADSGYSGFAWMMGTQFNAYLLPGQTDDVWDLTKQLNAEAMPAPTIGFAFNRENVKTEIANVKTASEELNFIAKNGLGDLDAYKEKRDETLERVADAGMEKFLTELQAQVDAWAATK